MHDLLYGNKQRYLHHLVIQSLLVSNNDLQNFGNFTFLSGSYTFLYGICKVWFASTNIRSENVRTVAFVRGKKISKQIIHVNRKHTHIHHARVKSTLYLGQT